MAFFRVLLYLCCFSAISSDIEFSGNQDFTNGPTSSDTPPRSYSCFLHRQVWPSNGANRRPGFSPSSADCLAITQSRSCHLFRGKQNHATTDIKSITMAESFSSNGSSDFTLTAPTITNFESNNNQPSNPFSVHQHYNGAHVSPESQAGDIR